MKKLATIAIIIMMATSAIAATKAELLVELKAKLGDGFVIKDSLALVETTTSDDDAHTIKRYYISVVTTGADDADSKGIGQKRSLEFYVLDEGAAGEKAYYKDNTWTNPESQAWSGSTLKAMALIYDNKELRSRTLGAVLKAAFDIINEDSGTANHDKRVLLAGKVMQDVAAYQNAFMFFVATNPTVQSSGPGATTDNDLQYIINTNWDSVAKAVGLIAL